jgi:hypothetical protein
MTPNASFVSAQGNALGELVTTFVSAESAFHFDEAGRWPATESNRV